MRKPLSNAQKIRLFLFFVFNLIVLFDVFILISQAIDYFMYLGYGGSFSGAGAGGDW